MTNKEILEKAIKLAIDGGLGWTNPVVDTGDELGSIHSGLMCRFNDELMNVESVIFNHDFAKALWGEEHKPFALIWARLSDKDALLPYFNPTVPKDDPKQVMWAVENHQILAWQWHLQRMVVAEDPIKYLGDNLPGDK